MSAMDVDEAKGMAPGPNETSKKLSNDDRSKKGIKQGASIGAVFLAVAAVYVCQGDNLSNHDLQTFTQHLLSIDKVHNNVYDKLYVEPSGPKFLNILDDFSEAELFNGPTIAPLIALQDYYKPDVLKDEEYTEKHETFLNAIMNTEVMKETEFFLLQREIIQEPLKDILKHMWFGMFSKDEACKKCAKDICDCKPIVGSSGFEHVFAAETLTKLTKAGHQGKKVVQGLHNWIYFLRKQADKNFKYTMCNGKLKLEDKADLISLTFNWEDMEPKRSTMFLGTSPEFEMALYSICFLTRHNKPCHVNMSGKVVTVITFSHMTDGKTEPDKKRKGTDILTSAYPSEEALPQSCDANTGSSNDDLDDIFNNMKI